MAVNQGREVKLTGDDKKAGLTVTEKIVKGLSEVSGSKPLAEDLRALVRYHSVLTTNAQVDSAVAYLLSNGIQVSRETVLLANQATAFDISDLRNRQYFDLQATAIV